MLDRRVQALEIGMKDVKATLSRLEIAFDRFAEKLSHMATSADVARVEGNIARVGGRLSQIPSTWQIIGILAAFLFGVASLVYATNNFLAQKSASSIQTSAPK